MFKISKYITRTGIYSQMLKRGYSSNAKCPPSYECERPQKSDDEESMRQKVHPILTCKSHKDPGIYKNLLLYVFLPIVVCVYFNMEEETRRPKFVEFSYMRIRNKRYPWDPVRTLFHNPVRNALPTGYEVPVPEDQEYDPFEPDKK